MKAKKLLGLGFGTLMSLLELSQDKHDGGVTYKDMMLIFGIDRAPSVRSGLMNQGFIYSEDIDAQRFYYVSEKGFKAALIIDGELSKLGYAQQ